MHVQFADVKVLIWDFDGTLYKMNPEIARDCIEADYEVVMRHTGWEREKAIQEFNNVYMVTTPSSTVTAARLSNISVVDTAIECERYKNRNTYLSLDPQLQTMFRSLSQYRHVILANGIVEKVTSALHVLGIESSQFEDIVTSEKIGVNKPDFKGFEYIMRKTGLSASAHLMIGDREAVDLAPAKALGMKTCLVWTEATSTLADVTLKTVYEVGTILV